MAIRIDTTPEGTNTFDFVTNKLGRITIQDFRIFGSPKFSNLLIEGNSTNELLFRNLLLDIGRKYDSPKKKAKKLKLTGKDVYSIENGELEQIACKFLESNKVSLENIDPEQPLKRDNETYVDCLVRLFKKQQENWTSQATKKAVSDFQSPIEFSASRLTDLRRQLDDNLIISGQLGYQLSLHRPGFDDALTVSSQIAKSAESNQSITTIANQVSNLSPLIESSAALIKSLNDTSRAVAAKFSTNIRTSFYIGIGVLLIAIVGLFLPYFINQNSQLLESVESISSALGKDADSVRTILNQTNSKLARLQIQNAKLSILVDSLKIQFESTKPTQLKQKKD